MSVILQLLDNSSFVEVFRTDGEDFDLPFRFAELVCQFLLQCPPSCGVDIAEERAVLDAFQAVIEADVGDFFADPVFNDVVHNVGVHKL